MNQTLLSKLEAKLSPEELDFRLDIGRWLNKYPWSHLWTPTFRNAELRGSASYTRSSARSTVLPSASEEFLGAAPSYSRSGGGTFAQNPFWKDRQEDGSFGKEKGLHTSGFSQKSAIQSTRRFLRREMKDFSWFFVAEQNPGREGHHVHCLLIPPAGERINVPRLSAIWWKRYGWNKFEPIRGGKEVTSYCVKHVTSYVLKGDDFLKPKKSQNVGWEIEINDSAIFHAARENS